MGGDPYVSDISCSRGDSSVMSVVVEVVVWR